MLGIGFARRAAKFAAESLSGTGLLAELRAARAVADDTEGRLQRYALEAFNNVRKSALEAARSSKGGCLNVRCPIVYFDHRGDNHYAREAVSRRLQELLRKEGISATFDNAYEYVSFNF